MGALRGWLHVNLKQVVTAVRGGVYCIMLQAESIFLRRRLENETNRTCLPAADELGHGKRNVPVISKPPIACFGSFDRVRRYCANHSVDQAYLRALPIGEASRQRNLIARH
jgi:hypothetical protein